ncbi:acyl carrier protein [Cytophagales bacterium WSM2-2]|nr:acyl carrier protein [Cytophagales bacterium WSM2-2]
MNFYFKFAVLIPKTMELSEFVSAFSSQFEQTDPSLVIGSTDYKNLDEWDSLIALSVIALADEQYGVTLTGDDIRNAVTVSDLFERIKALKK